MHVLYVDESGTQKEARHFVVAGLSAFERDTYFLAQSLDKLQATYFPDAADPIELHAAPLSAPEGRVPAPFDQLTKEQRWALKADVYAAIAESRAYVYGVVMEKTVLGTEDPYERGFEELVNRFDRMLMSLYRDHQDPQRGLVIIAESSYRENLETLARRIWSQGHRWGQLYNMADIPYFAPARSTRLLQVADFVSNAVYTRYENKIARDLDLIAPRLYQSGGHLHGLIHISADSSNCYCPACVARRAG